MSTSGLHLLTAEEKTRRQRERRAHALIHAIEMQARATARVRRATTVLHKWSAARRRLERAIGAEEVQRLIDTYHATKTAKQQQRIAANATRRIVNS